MFIVFALLIICVILFALDKLAPDSIVLVCIIILVLTGIITPSQAFAGYGSDFIIMLSSIFIISAALQHNGVVEYFSNRLTGSLTKNYFVTIIIVMMSVGILSAFMNNTTVVAVMVLPVLGLCQRIKQPASWFLMPLAFASLLGGTCSLIGTSTNIAGSDFLAKNGLTPLAMFEFLPIGAVLLVIATCFFALLGRRVLPSENGDGDRVDQVRKFHSHVTISDTSTLNDMAVKKIAATGVTVVSIKNKEGEVKKPEDYVLKAGDDLYLEGDSDALQQFYTKYALSAPPEGEVKQKPGVAEMMVLPASFVVNSTLKGSKFTQKTGLTPIGIYRKGHRFTTNLVTTKIKTGDILIVEGHDEDIAKVRHRNNFIILTQQGKAGLPNLEKGFISLGIFALCIITVTLGLVPPSIAFLSGVLLTMSFRVLPPDAVYAKVDWRLIILIGGMTAFGTAISETGGDRFLAGLITDYFSGASTLMILFAFMILTVLLTQPMSNAAAALVILPIALETANVIGADPRGFCIGIILSASVSMLTPFEPACLLVLGPGKYKISHFFKIGGLLTVCCLGVILFMITMLYDL